MAADPNQQLQALNNQESSLLKRLSASPTARSGEQKPSMSDISTQQRLLKTRSQVESIRDKQLQEKWYGKSDEQTQPVGGDPGFVGKTLDVLARPLRGVVGAVDYATGKSGAPSLSQAVSQNIMQSKRTFGDVLKDTGLPGPVSAPLGFVLDVAFDPVNWVTAGTSALVPRVAGGLVQGTLRGGLSSGIRAAAKGAESGILESALTARNLGRVVTGAKSSAKPIDELGRVGKFMRGVEDRSIKSLNEYDTLTGRDVLGDVSKAGLPIPGGESRYRVRLGDLIREGASRVPFVQKYFKYFDYNNAEWTRLARIKDTLLKVSGTDEEMKAGVKAFIKAHEDGIPYDQALEQARLESGISERAAAATVSPEINWEAADQGGKELNNFELDKALSEIVGSMPKIKDASEAVDILKAPDAFISADHMENALRLAAEDTKSSISLDDLKDIVGRGELGDTGVKWFDDLKRDIRGIKYEVGIGNKKTSIGNAISKTIDGYQAYISFFKRGKVGASPTAWTNAVLGNPTMAWMAGVNILDPQYMSRIKDASKLVRGTRDSDILLGDFLQSAEMLKVMDTNPSLFKKTTGMSPKYLQAKYLLERIVRTGRDEGLISDTTNINELGKSLGYAFDEISDALHEVTQGVPAAERAVGAIGAAVPKIPSQRPSQMVRQLLSTGKPISEGDLPVGMLANEFFDSKMANKAFEYISKRAQEGNPVYKLLDLSFNKASEAYEGIDQTFKVGTTMYATMDGFTEGELKIISRMMDLDPSDLTKVTKDGVRRYRMSGVKALELANEIYLNYNAMPAAVKVLRNLPLVGSPFASFMYGMGMKTGKTLAYNPAVFNKVSFAMNDFGGSKSPLEKGVLSDPRYAYLNAPGMMKIPGIVGSPFFEKNAIYLNMTNMIPYYSFNMFTPSERRYSDLYPSKVVEAIDKSPFLKDPVGSTIFDYLIQPMIIQNERLMGSFGQPLYPSDAGALEKTGYMARSLVDPVVPGFWSPVGGVAQGYLAPNATEMMPSYRWRQVANALQGKTSIGKTSKEDPTSRTLRSLLGSAGVPVQSPVPLTYLPKNLKKNLESK